MRQAIERDVAGGFSTPDKSSSRRSKATLTDEIPIARPRRSSFFAKHSPSTAAAQATWPAETDCDRLDKAFADLEQHGIVARQNFSDCGTCGVAEIPAEIDAAKKSGSKCPRLCVLSHARYRVGHRGRRPLSQLWLGGSRSKRSPEDRCRRRRYARTARSRRTGWNHRQAHWRQTGLEAPPFLRESPGAIR